MNQCASNKSNCVLGNISDSCINLTPSEKIFKNQLPNEDMNKFDWSSSSSYIYEKLSEEFMREFADKLDWKHICIYQNLSEEFIREFADKVSWTYISSNLSEEFIREFADKVDWEIIFYHQSLSEEFIKEFAYKIDWVQIDNNGPGNYSKSFINKIQKYNLKKEQQSNVSRSYE